MLSALLVLLLLSSLGLRNAQGPEDTSKLKDFEGWVERVDAKVKYFTLKKDVKAGVDGGDVENLPQGTKIIETNGLHFVVRASEGYLVQALAMSRYWKPTETHVSQILQSPSIGKTSQPKQAATFGIRELALWAREEQTSILVLKFDSGVCTEAIKVNGDDGTKSLLMLQQGEHYHGLLKVGLSKTMQRSLQEDGSLDLIQSTKEESKKAQTQTLPDPELAGLRRFMQLMESWSTSHTPNAKLSLMTAQQALQSFVVQNLQAFQIRPNVILLMGDQSSGKSTTAIALTGQVVFYVDPKTGTKARTLITVTYSPGLKDVTASFQYKGAVHKNLSPNQLASVMDSTFRDSPIDASNLASVNIQLKEPSFGVSIVDHPGVVITNLEETLAASRLSLKQYFTDDSSSQSIVLLCQTAATWDLSAAGWAKLREDFKAIPEGNMYVAVTRMDELTISSVATGIINSKKYPGNSVTALQVLEYMKADIEHHLGRSAHILFVSSSSAAWETLQNMSPEQRWTEFQRSQQHNEQKMVDRLLDKADWKSSGIHLKDMTVREREAFDQQLQMKNLLAALLRRQHEGTLQLAVDIASMVDKRKRDSLDQYITLQENIHHSRELPELVLQFWKNLTTQYHAMTVQPSYTNSQLSSFHAHYAQLVDKLGYTLEEELDLYNSFPDRGEFPPPDRRISNYEEIIKVHQADFVRPAAEKLHLLPSLLRRMQAEFAFRTQLILIPELNAQEIQKAGTGGGALQTFDLKEALSNKVASEFSKIYGSLENGGNKAAAIRGGMAFLAHAQTVATVLCHMEEYFPLLQRDNSEAAPKREGEEKGPSRVLNLFANVPLFSKHQRHKASLRDVDPAPHAFVKLSDVYEEYQSLQTKKTPAGADTTRSRFMRKPRDDLIHVLIAKYFDSPMESIRSQLDHRTNALKLTQPSFIASSLTFAPHFIHQDKEHLTEYKETYPRDDFAQAFLSGLPPPADTIPNIAVKGVEEVVSEADPMKGVEAFAADVIKNVLPLTSDGIQRGRPHEPIDLKAPLFLEARKQAVIGQMLRDLDLQPLTVRLDLLSSLIRQASGPDIFPQPQAAGDLNRFEHNELNYVFRRYLTAGFFEAMHETLRTIVASSFEVTDQAKTPHHQGEVYERYCSLLLGYDQPYTISERPSAQSHLDPDHVIPFLARNVKYLVLSLDKWDATILSDEVKYARSPLVGKVFRMLGIDARAEAPDDGVTPKTVDSGKVEYLIQSLYQAHKRRDSDSDHFHKLLILELVPERYPLFSLQDIQQKNLQQAVTALEFWKTADLRLGDFIGFVKQHGAKFGSIHDIPPGVNSLKPHLSTVLPVDRHDPQHEEEAEVIVSV